MDQRMRPSKDASGYAVAVDKRDSDQDGSAMQDYAKHTINETDHQLCKLFESAFARPFYFKLQNSFGAQIFPSCLTDPEARNCLSDVRDWQLKQRDCNMEGMIEISLKILNRHIEFYRNGPEETHDEDYSSDEIVCMAEHLKTKINTFKDGHSEEKLELINDPVTKVYEKMREIFPQNDPIVLLAKSKEYVSKYVGVLGADLDLTDLIDEILRPSTRSNECRIFPFYPSKFHDFEEANISHFYTASHQFYKMVLRQAPIPARPIINPFQAIQSIEYIENDISTERYQHCKARMKVKSDECAKEILLFHGTDVQNIDSIFNTNFNIDSSPVDRSKAMVYGRGIYMSEFPGVSLNYGKGLLLCKVLPGCTESISMDDRSARTGTISDQFDCREVVKGGEAVMHVIKNSDQILPYCVINLHNISQGMCPPSHGIPPICLPRALRIQPTPPSAPGIPSILNQGMAPPSRGIPPLSLPRALGIQPTPPTASGILPTTHVIPPTAHFIPPTAPISGQTQEWTTDVYRSSIIRKLEEALRDSGNPNMNNASDMEKQVFHRSKTREEYLGYVARLILHARQQSLGKQNVCVGNMGIQSQGAASAFSASNSLVTLGTTASLSTSPQVGFGTSSQTFSGSAMSQDNPADLIQLPSSSVVSPFDDEGDEYKRKLKDMKKYVEPLKKKLENADPSRYKKLEKLLKIITTPQKKVPLTILLNCENALKRCLP